MTQTNPKCFHQSASSIAAFKACPQRFRLAYREGLRLAEDTDSQRVGTVWHKLHEVYYEAKTLHDPDVQQALPDPHDYAVSVVIEYLNQCYAHCPTYKTMSEWELERQILLTCFVGYLWYWQNDPIEVLASEVPFNLPIHAPKVGLPLPMDQVQRVGKIDHIIKWQNMVGSLERKSTSRSIAPDSDYWDKSKKDTQVSMYALAMRDLDKSRSLPIQLEEFLYGNNEQRAESQALPSTPGNSVSSESGGPDTTNGQDQTINILRDPSRVQPLSREAEALSPIPSSQSSGQVISDRVRQGGSKSQADMAGNPEMRRFVCELPLVPACRRADVNYGTCLYDVWHKPTIKPAMLTQKETAEFIASGVYCEQEFKVGNWLGEAVEGVRPQVVHVNENPVEVEQGKKGFAIRETVEMYGARLLQDIYKRPDFYFQRREIVRTDKELAKFRVEGYNIYQTQRTMDQTGNWYENEQQCRATYACSYIPICYGVGADAVCDGKTMPPGFKRIFVDLTVNGQEQEE